MWGYGRGEDSGIVPHKTQEEHFQLFCMVMERGFPLHTGSSGRLLVEYRLSDADSQRCLPRVSARRGVSFRIPDQLLLPSDVYLYYEPALEGSMPEMARFTPETGTFTPLDHQAESLLAFSGSDPMLPVVKLSSLRGLHYTKDIACLQLYRLDYGRLLQLDEALARQLREILVKKMARYIQFSDPWFQATQAERAARDYLALKGQLALKTELAPKAQRPGNVAALKPVYRAPVAGERRAECRDELGFLSWE